MKLPECNPDGKSAIKEALRETEALADFCGLSEKNSLYLRLLAEELLGMATGVPELRNGSFTIEAEKMKFILYLSVRSEVGEQAKNWLLDASSTGEKAVHKGITGKIRQTINFLLVTPSTGTVTPTGMSALACGRIGLEIFLRNGRRFGITVLNSMPQYVL